MTERAGIRELRQYLSRYIDRVKAGETIEVTERGRPIAVLAPLNQTDDSITELERQGVNITRSRLDFRSLAPIPQPEPGERSLSEILGDLRRSERY